MGGGGGGGGWGAARPLRGGGGGVGAAALLFTAIAELLVEAFQIKENAGTIAIMAAGFLLFMILMMVM